MRRRLLLVPGLVLGLSLLAGPEPAGRAKAPPPRKVAAFTLEDVTGRPRSLADFRDKKALVVVFIGTECPISNSYVPRLAELHAAFAPRGVQFLAVNSNSQDTPARIAGHAREHGIPFPVLKDTAAAVADRFGARRTPEAFVLDPAG